ncbi:MAG: vWA domain-containing protein [Geminicoccaceae bacterium]
MTDAVRQAAETLRYTEERATVILVSDGKETCDVDPCAAAAELEASGVDFTGHVVGFDLDAEERAQLQCLAETTDGRFLSAASASELHEAMATTVELVTEPDPKPKRVIEVEKADVGTVSVTNTIDDFYVRLPDQTSGGFIAQLKDGDPIQLQAGSYRLDSNNQEALARFDIAPGEEVVIDIGG